MGVNSTEYKNGYEDAIEAIKKALQGGSASGSSMRPDPRLAPPPVNNPNDKNKGGSDQQGNQNSNSQDNSNSRGSGNQGVVRPEDCIGPDELSDIPSTPGGFIDQLTGDQIAKSEGYDEGGSESAIEKDWAETAMKEMKKFQGKIGGKFITKITDLYAVTHDWKQELKKIVGKSISPENKRQAYTNKNVLVSQGRIARTDKDKYDNLDYMCAFIDSSGSMSDDQLKMVLSHIYTVALAKKPIKLYVIQCDTQIQDIQEYTDLKALKRDLRNATVKGRGETELKPCWDLLLTDKRFKGKIADLVMVFTDGICVQYKRNPKTMKNICWVILDNPKFELQYKDINTKKVIIKTDNLK
ncbi:MAG: hypothetical protein IKU29_02260 [Parabacteroides sp.]|nr:hypothetical protein [Parabacteroides sp.]